MSPVDEEDSVQMASTQTVTDLAAVNYFHGRLSRDAAAGVLNDAGCIDGMFLLRESLAVSQQYALSLCHMGSVHHYCIDRHENAMFSIDGGKQFSDPVELVQHYEFHADGLLCSPTIPCRREPTTKVRTFSNIIVKQTADENAVPLSDLHLGQDWFHGDISREKAEERVRSCQEDGSFLVRRKSDGNFVLGLSYQNECKHYLVDWQRNGDGKLAIEDGQPCDSLVQLVDYYRHTSNAGLWCELKYPIARRRRGSEPAELPSRSKLAQVPSYAELEANAGSDSGLRRKSSGASPTLAGDMDRKQKRNNACVQRSKHVNRRPMSEPVLHPSSRPNILAVPKTRTRLDSDLIASEDGCHGDNGSSTFYVDLVEDVWDEPEYQDSDDVAPPGGADDSVCEDFDKEEDSRVYSTAAAVQPFKLSSQMVTLTEMLGSGNFGSVMRGNYKFRATSVPVAVKVLKVQDAAAREELTYEAQIMAKLTHINIIRLLGVCDDIPFMMVLELASLGPLNKYLQNHHKFPVHAILALMVQVCRGMEYLESVNYVHRDLAARNVLLANEKVAKIADFGMSRALRRNANYYQAAAVGKWPLKWYAPECIYYFKFDSKSDVWSYGVTFWEAISYGGRPYTGMKGHEILAMLESGGRLQQTDKCPDTVYKLMMLCWRYQKKERPTFRELLPKVESCCGKIQK